MSAILAWFNGWRRDMDGWWVRARRYSDPTSLPSEIGLVEESAIAVRSTKLARTVDARRAALSQGDAEHG